MVFGIVMSILFGIMICVTAGYAIYVYHKNKREKYLSAQEKKELESLRKLKESIKQADENSINEGHEGDVQPQSFGTLGITSSIVTDEAKIKIDQLAAKAKIEELESRLSEMKETLIKNASNIEMLEQNNKLLQDHLTKETENNTQLKKYYDDLKLERDSIELARQKMAEQLILNDQKAALQVDLKAKVDDLNAQLEEMKVRYSKAVMEDYESMVDTLFNWDSRLNEKEKHIIELIRQLEEEYPELKEELATIEWKKIWMPMLQDEGSASLNISGIYMLVMKDDNNCVYIGQATNIKDRWYTHIKKMLGVTATGKEKLYRYKPEEFIWTVLEKVDNKGCLDDAEKYWIGYFAAKDRGLNKKAF